MYGEIIIAVDGFFQLVPFYLIIFHFHLFLQFSIWVLFLFDSQFLFYIFTFILRNPGFLVSATILLISLFLSSYFGAQLHQFFPTTSFTHNFSDCELLNVFYACSTVLNSVELKL